jgi:hypothetical protein
VLVETDVEQWWSRVAATAPDHLSGLWFGLTELSPGGWHLYVAGTETFDPDDETAEWATGPYAWWPDDRYFPFAEIATVGVAEAVERAAEVVRGIAPWTDVLVQGVATGFDDGDFQVVYQR